MTFELNLELSVGVSGWACPVGLLVTLVRRFWAGGRRKEGGRVRRGPVLGSSS